MSKPIVMPHIAPADRTAAVTRLMSFSEGLIETNQRLWERVWLLEDEVAVLKGEKKRPKFKPSRMNEDAGQASGQPHEPEVKPVKRAGSAKRSKTGQLKIDHDQVIQPAEPIPPGSRFKVSAKSSTP